MLLSNNFLLYLTYINWLQNIFPHFSVNTHVKRNCDLILISTRKKTSSTIICAAIAKFAQHVNNDCIYNNKIASGYMIYVTIITQVNSKQ